MATVKKSTVKTTNSQFVQKVISRSKESDVEVIAQRNFRKATSAIDQEIAAQQAKVVDLEQTVEDKEEELTNAIYPITPIGDGKLYLQNIKNAQFSLDEAKEKYDAVQAWIAQLEEIKAEHIK